MRRWLSAVVLASCARATAAPPEAASSPASFGDRAYDLHHGGFYLRGRLDGGRGKMRSGHVDGGAREVAMKVGNTKRVKLDIATMPVTLVEIVPEETAPSSWIAIYGGDGSLLGAFPTDETRLEGETIFVVQATCARRVRSAGGKVVLDADCTTGASTRARCSRACPPPTSTERGRVQICASGDIWVHATRVGDEHAFAAAMTSGPVELVVDLEAAGRSPEAVRRVQRWLEGRNVTVSTRLGAGCSCCDTAGP